MSITAIRRKPRNARQRAQRVRKFESFDVDLLIESALLDEVHINNNIPKTQFSTMNVQEKVSHGRIDLADSIN